MTTTIAALNSPQIRYAEFVKITNASFTDYFCNAPSNVTVSGMTFTGMGSYLGVSEIQQDMKSTSTDVKLSITGLSLTNVGQVLDAKMKGSTITIWRGFLDSNNQIETLSSVLQFFQRYQGIVNNIAITENFDSEQRDRTATCVISSASMRLVLDSRVAGIRTNPSNWQFIYPGDTSMSRVPAIASTYFNFGGQPTTGSNTQVPQSLFSDISRFVKFNNTNGF